MTEYTWDKVKLSKAVKAVNNFIETDAEEIINKQLINYIKILIFISQYVIDRCPCKLKKNKK